MTLQTSVKVADLLASPGNYVGKTVRVDGVVQAVSATPTRRSTPGKR